MERYALFSISFLQDSMQTQKQQREEKIRDDINKEKRRKKDGQRRKESNGVRIRQYIVYCKLL